LKINEFHIFYLFSTQPNELYTNVYVLPQHPEKLVPKQISCISYQHVKTVTVGHLCT